MDSSLPPLKRMRSSRIFVIGSLSICLLTHTLLYGFILPVLPSALVERFSILPSHVNRWISILLTAEALATLLTSPAVGYLITILRGPRLSLLLGIILLGISMTIIGTARSIGVLVTGRIVQGISSAIIQVVSFSIILDCSPEDAIGHSTGYAGAAMNIGFLGGPLLGGVLYAFLGWNGLFGVVGGVLALNLFVPLAIMSAEHNNDGHTVIQPSLASPQQDAKPFSLLTLLRESKMQVGICGVIVSGIFISAIDTVLAVFVENVFKWNSLGQGLIFLPVSIPALLEPVYGWVTDRYGARIVGFVSFLALVPFSICLRTVTSDSIDAKVILCSLLAGIGVFLDATEPAGYVLIDDVLEEMQHKSGIKYDWRYVVARSFGVQNAAHYLGITVGPIVILLLPESGRLGAVGLLLGCLSALAALLWIWGVGAPKSHESAIELTPFEIRTESQTATAEDSVESASHQH